MPRLLVFYSSLFRIVQSDLNKLILFFNGLGMDEKTLCNFNHKGFDVCMFYNYNELTSIKDSFKEYDEIYVIAWSMGE